MDVHVVSVSTSLIAICRVVLGVDAVATHVFSAAKVPVQQWFCLTLVHSKARALGTPEFKVTVA